MPIGAGRFGRRRRIREAAILRPDARWGNARAGCTSETSRPRQESSGRFEGWDEVTTLPDEQTGGARAA